MRHTKIRSCPARTHVVAAASGKPRCSAQAPPLLPCLLTVVVRSKFVGMPVGQAIVLVERAELLVGSALLVHASPSPGAPKSRHAGNSHSWKMHPCACQPAHVTVTPKILSHLGPWCSENTRDSAIQPQLLGPWPAETSTSALLQSHVRR